MKKHLKQQIQNAFEAPLPNQQEKTRFLKTIPKSKISTWKFIFMQFTYLRKWVLVLSMLLLFPALKGAYYISQNTLWIISAFIPFLGLLAVTESTRSSMYGMSEFELSTRFSLKCVVLARLGILGVTDMVVLCCLIPLCCASSKFSLLQTGLYLLVPYLFTTNISLWITRRFHNQEAVYGCMGIAILVSITNTVLHFMADFVYQFSYFNWWIILFLFLIGKLIYEIYYTIKQTEEYTWNSSLTD